ncbi:SusC/RagA family TonB-linked outer membrane protein [Bacteroidia bacterium]|nr:SusC/RagA family TonB-linked outer membrane protein [Bacteroidia bacterium]
MPLWLSAQDLNISGTVLDGAGDPVVGATVMVKGTTTGVTTGINGDYNIVAPPNGTLVFSLLGMGTREEAISGRGRIDIVLSDNAQAIDEVVVMGYGVQKKKLVTGATVQVGGDDLQKLSTTSALTAMQSQTAGVSIIQSSGQPGEGFKVNIRGIGTTGNSAPLYVIDGVAGGDINNLNPADIESIDVLKDAASAAIYGARAANGVILVTTKRGKVVGGGGGEGSPAGKRTNVSYDGYYGWQNVYKMPTALNARQYMNIMDEVNFNKGLEGYDWASSLGAYYEGASNGTWAGTDWLDEIRNKNAPTQNHAVNITGGNDISQYSIGLAYTGQEGILGAPVQSDYNRTTARINSDHVILRVGNLDVIKVGETFNYAYSTKAGIGIGNQYWNDISNMIQGMPIMPLYNADGEYFDYDDKVEMGLNKYSQAFANPIADMVYQRGYNISKNHNMQASANIQIQPIKNLVFKSQFGYRMNGNTYRSFAPTYKLTASAMKEKSEVRQSAYLGYNYTWDNTVNYNFSIAKSNFDVLVGQSIEKWGMGESVEAFNVDSKFGDFDHAYIDNTGAVVAGSTSVSGAPDGQGALASFFGRVNYDYNETYMVSLVLRADGSSNFARGKRWGYFPSVSAGWVLTNENFLKDNTASWLDFLKIRGSWGQNGNCNIPNFNYLANVAVNQNNGYSFGNNPDYITLGGYASILPNPNVTWETSEQVDLGLDARFLRSRLGLAFDWYTKTTKGWLVDAPILGSYGTGAPYLNGGDIKNTGVEIALNWRDQVGSSFRYGVGVNLTYNKNEVTGIANAEGIIHGPRNVPFQGSDEMYRAQVGYPIGYFWGYETSGVFQNQADIDAWKAAGNGILQPAVQPGDLKFTDSDHNGVIDEKDKVQLGNPHPKFLLGLDVNLAYKGFDLNLAGFGAFGHQIVKSYRKGDNFFSNYTTEVFQRWHGEGTSNKYPRLLEGNTTNYINFSDIYVENGDYFRCQNITLGYDFKQLFPKVPFGQLRLYVTAQNLFTITNYSGMDPEVGYSPDGNSGSADSWVSGIDIGYYPNPRTYLIGVNIKF